ncbi:zinc-binding domain-containing protein [Echria macrotheca]|uniref:Zinc-binding domain-containing protein n=1 Tax=Echria macrotheca TaxID=438768 RepID=A0AAJ0B0T6_9PEZI|nr:zinc-binding domain-containing protein [Echria macrotheca]
MAGPKSKSKPNKTKLVPGTKAPVAIFPHFHGKVLGALHGSINPAPSFVRAKQNPTDDYSTFIMGSFTCENNKCMQRGWGSKKICIVIRQFPGNGYNAQVFNQECKTCGELGKMQINVNAYVERVAFRLKKWAGVAVDAPPHTKRLDRPPHRSDLCEGCKRGYCQEYED